MRRFYLLFLSLLLAVAATADPQYEEHLHLEPLPQGLLLASFNFKSNATLQSFEQQHFKYIPRSLGQILQHARTKELHLRFSSGRWDAESWGARPWDGKKEGGTGVEVWAWIEADTGEEASLRWITLNHALSGLFCASLNFIDSTRTTRPVHTYEPVGDHSNTSLSNLHLLHGTLPREVVCTENLTPFLKLLPCKGKAGISSLLNGHKLFDASWQSMSIDVRPVCPESRSGCIVEMEQTVDMVLDIERSKRPHDNPIPRPAPADQLICDTSKSYSSSEACFPIDMSSMQSWSLSDVFGRPIKGSCLANDIRGDRSESVCISVPYEHQVFSSQGSVERKDPSSNHRCYVLPENDAFEMALPQQESQAVLPRPSPPLYASRSFTGHGQERGGVQSLLTNPSPNAAVSFTYFETLPWFMKPYLHTLKAQIAASPSQSQEEIIKSIYYRPALDRQRGTQLELQISVPPASTVRLTYDFEKAILRYTEYPPDANRGFDVAPAVIRLHPDPANPSSKAVYLRTTSLLLSLPTPDFSMPYNVIILTSTVIALAFGSIYNLLVRRFVGADEVESFSLAKVKARIKGRFAVIKDRFSMKKEKKTQ
ncbi:Subunit of the glycosylphosphatidylinositol transamidase complex-like protein [Xanthoria parietina]